MLRLHDTAEGRVVDMVPRQPGAFSMYVCGLTVYDVPHIGHGRMALVFDVLRRYLEWTGVDVTFVSNITDIEDKIIARAQERGVPFEELTATYEKAWYEASDGLGIKRPDADPHATAYVEKMVEFIADLAERGHAYETSDGVYFEVETLPGYGLLARQPLDTLRAGARVETDEEKRSPLDFALWKKAKPGEPSWPSPWGEGRPGWHIECSAMSMKYLGEHFDIHTGAVDNVFPHHENEIAQSEGATGHPFVEVWLHAEHLIVDGEKMAKSKGNFYTLDDVLARRDDPAAVRYLLLSVPYRKKLNFTWEALAGAAVAVDHIFTTWDRLTDFGAALGSKPSPFPAEERSEEFLRAFSSALDDDLNTPQALGALFPFLTEINKAFDERTLDAKGAEIARLAIETADK